VLAGQPVEVRVLSAAPSKMLHCFDYGFSAHSLAFAEGEGIGGRASFPIVRMFSPKIGYWPVSDPSGRV
jgi:hypothetical protein